MAIEWILALILSLSLMGTALFEMVTHSFICIDGRTGSIRPSGGESDKDYRILCGRQ